MTRDACKNPKRIVVKVGSQLLADRPAAFPADIAHQCAQLVARGVEVVVVSSGAIALGLGVLGFDTRPSTLPALQAAAAVGQPALMSYWEAGFRAHKIPVAQFLMTHDDFTNRERYLNAKWACLELLKRGIVPILNENDTVSVDEIRFGDNDKLAALFAQLIDADLLLILTSVDGLLDHASNCIAELPSAGAGYQHVRESKTAVGTGGMTSKLQAAEIAERAGIATMIGNGTATSAVLAALDKPTFGTYIAPREGRLAARKQWIAHSMTCKGTIVVDDGAERAVRENGGSLLAAGVLAVLGTFSRGDMVSLQNSQKVEFARGLAGYDADALDRIKGKQAADIGATLGYKYLSEVVHRDDLVILSSN